MSNVKNVQALEKLLGICTGLGGSYNPGKQNLQVKALTALMSQANNVLNEVRLAKTGYDNATNEREIAFSNLGPLSTRLISALKASGAESQKVADARTMVRKINGSRIKDRAPITTENGDNNVTKRRARGLDYATLTANFAKLLQTIGSETTYQPNEQELKVEELKKHLAALQKQNGSVIAATVAWQNARIKRDQVLYTLERNLFDTGMMAKDYIKSVYGYGSDVHRTVSKIRFTKPKM